MGRRNYKIHEIEFQGKDYMEDLQYDIILINDHKAHSIQQNLGVACEAITSE